MAKGLARPSFIESLLESFQDDYKHLGARSLIPVWVLISVGAGAGSAYFVPHSFWIESLEVPVGVFGALLTLNGLILALSWSAFSKIYETVAAEGFVQYLHQKNMLHKYFFMIDFIHLTQILSVLASASGLFISLLPVVPLEYKFWIFGAAVASSVYSFRYASGSVSMMQDLVWLRLQYENEFKGRDRNSTVIDMNNKK
jgi:hypothetical protein